MNDSSRLFCGLPSMGSRSRILGALLGSVAIHFLIVFGTAYASDYLSASVHHKPAPPVRAVARRNTPPVEPVAPSVPATPPALRAEAWARVNEPTSAIDLVTAGPDGEVREFLRSSDGIFDVVVLGSPAAGAFPGADGVLQGTLVYTVFLRVGTPRDWILQFCLQKEMENSLSPGKGSLPLDGPYPLRMLQPDITFPPDVEYLLVHGIASAAGRFEQLEWVGDPPPDAGTGSILRELERWELRPAKRDGVPIAVEILLLIPASDL